jgi:uncharacterized repeat protein (TIGR01451 family)
MARQIVGVIGAIVTDWLRMILTWIRMAGGELTYTITVTNLGPDTAFNVVITDLLPASVIFVAAPGCMVMGRVFEATTQVLGPAVLTIAKTDDPDPAAVGGTLTYTIRIANASPTPAQNVVLILAADLAVTKTANQRAQVGQGLTYTVTVTNNGPSTATGVTLVDTLVPGQTETVNDSGGSPAARLPDEDGPRLRQ